MPSFTSGGVENEAKAFYVQYGKAVEAWASVERILGDCFRLMTGLDHGPSDAIYYSGRSFQTRRDLLHAMLPHSKLADDANEFIREALKKASSYGEARNKIAHRAIFYNARMRRVELRDGDDHDTQSKDVFLEADLAHIAANLGDLEIIIFDVLFSQSGEHSAQPQAGLQRLSELPKAAHHPTTIRSTRVRPALLVPSQW